MLRIILCLGSLVWLGVHSYPYFANLIPNGKMVPNPCNPDYIWPGVGHQAILGVGAMNPFGRDFAKKKYEWTEELCKTDSDKDNRTNGEELGDPGCSWSLGDTNTTSDILSHPGICEPIDHPECIAINDFLQCPDDLQDDLQPLTTEPLANTTTTVGPPGCLSHADQDNSTSVCDGKHIVHDSLHEMTYCCEGNSTRPIGHRTVNTTGQMDFSCRCVLEDEFCQQFPLFC